MNREATLTISKPPMTSPDMDAVIWSNLPEELLERVLSMLPLKTFMLLRPTCKRFKSLLFSPSFISKHSSSSSSSSPFSSFLLLSHPQCYPNFPLYDSPLGAWRSFPLSFSELLPCSAGQVSLLSISNGLLCFSIPSSSSFVVCNFLTKSSRVIKFPTYPFDFELLTLVSTPLGYYIFMLSYGSSTMIKTFVFDSKHQSWQIFSEVDTISGDSRHQEGVYFEGSLYFSTSEPFGIVCFNLGTGKWEKADTELPLGLTFVRIVSDERNMKLYVIGGIGRNGISRSMKMWELCGGKNWVEIENVPEMMCRKMMSVCYHNYELLYCFWHQGLICVCCYSWPEILYYKVSRRTWHWLPKCPSVPERWACGFRWFSFVPDLYASV